MALQEKDVVGLFIRDKSDNSIIQELRHGEVLLGRGHGNDIRLNHATVSSRHARIYTYLTVSYIEDLGSTNGTFINDQRIDKHVLHPGDVIRLGEYQLVMDQRHINTAQETAAGSNR